MIVVALGSNLAGPAGEPRAQVEAALRALAAHGVVATRRSRWWRSPAWPDPSDPFFVNGVAAVETTQAPAALMESLHAVETALGRQRGRRNAPRTIDLDLIDYNGEICASGEGPRLPHPRLTERLFVLHPLAELAPDWRHPVSGLPIATLIAALVPDPLVEPLEIT